MRSSAVGLLASAQVSMVALSPEVSGATFLLSISACLTFSCFLSLFLFAVNFNKNLFNKNHMGFKYLLAAVARR